MEAPGGVVCQTLAFPGGDGCEGALLPGDGAGLACRVFVNVEIAVHVSGHATLTPKYLFINEQMNLNVEH